MQILNNTKRKNRFAHVIAITEDGYVLYNAYEGKNLIVANMVRPIEYFSLEYDI